MSRQKKLEKSIKLKADHLHALEEGVASLGGPFHAPHRINEEIEYTRAELKRLRSRWKVEQRCRLETLLARICESHRVTRKQVSNEYGLDIIKNGCMHYVFLSRLTGKPIADQTIKKIARLATAQYEWEPTQTIWVEYRSRKNRYYLLRLMWGTGRYIIQVERPPLPIRVIEQWFGLPPKINTHWSA